MCAHNDDAYIVGCVRTMTMLMKTDDAYDDVRLESVQYGTFYHSPAKGHRHQE